MGTDGGAERGGGEYNSNVCVYMRERGTDKTDRQTDTPHTVWAVKPKRASNS